MIRWPEGPTSSDSNSTFRIGRKKADEDQLQPTVRNTLRKLSRPTKKNCRRPTVGLSVHDARPDSAEFDVFLGQQGRCLRTGAYGSTSVMLRTAFDIHQSDMSDETQHEALQVALLAVNMYKEDNDIARYIKMVGY
ncbi:hypothetical protein DPX16_3327 [Anabarilius grahami]|uniref:Uncharacterized protein n=1 Tax=Anabarilius grahami TaxID=495550 RepID=A0A3N0XLB2_ANAGA|nr:hypothetical protein DPX16_3327 [Anabarilius grahami]